MIFFYDAMIFLYDAMIFICDALIFLYEGLAGFSNCCSSNKFRLGSSDPAVAVVITGFSASSSFVKATMFRVVDLKYNCKPPIYFDFSSNNYPRSGMKLICEDQNCSR